MMKFYNDLNWSDWPNQLLALYYKDFNKMKGNAGTHSPCKMIINILSNLSLETNSCSSQTIYWFITVIHSFYTVGSIIPQQKEFQVMIYYLIKLNAVGSLVPLQTEI